MTGSDWIKSKAKELREQEKAAEENRKWRMHKHEVLKEKAPSFWKTVVDLTLQYAREYNEQFPEKEKKIGRIEQTQYGFILDRNCIPAVSVVANFDRNSFEIEYNINYAPDIDPKHSRTDKNTITLTLTDSEHVNASGHGTNPETLAKLFLDPFFRFTF